jgi:putative ABC transport system permease protein
MSISKFHWDSVRLPGFVTLTFESLKAANNPGKRSFASPCYPLPMNKLIVGNLVYRPVRTIVTMLAVAIEMVMILCIVGVMIGQVANNRSQTSGIGADIIVQPPNSSFFAAIGGAPVPAKISDILGKLPHVAVAAPVITDISTVGTVETIWGIDYPTYNALKPFVFLSGTPFQGPDDVIVDDFFSRADGGHKVGQHIQIKGHPFRICGIVEHGKGGRKFVPIRTLGALLGNANNASLFYLRSDSDKNQGPIESEIHATPGLSQYKVQTIQGWLSLMTPEHLPGFTPALDSVISIAVIVGFLVIFQSMYTAVMERTREIGILKSLGASRGYIVSTVLREAALVTVAGMVLGILLTEAIHSVLVYKMPTFSFIIPTAWWFRSLGIAFIGALLGAAYPALKAASKDPIEALAYE